MSESFLYFCSIGFVIDVSYDFILSCSRKKKSGNAYRAVNLEASIEKLGSRNISVIFIVPDHQNKNHHEDGVHSNEPEAHIHGQKEKAENPDEDRPSIISIDLQKSVTTNKFSDRPNREISCPDDRSKHFDFLRETNLFHFYKEWKEVTSTF